MLSQTTFEQFKSAVAEARAAGKKVVTVVREILGDFITPVMAYIKLVGYEGGALLESVSGGKHQGRYSIIGVSPYMKFHVRKGQAIRGLGSPYRKILEERNEVLTSDAPLELLKKLLEEFSPIRPPGCDFFCGGAIGYIGHEAITLLEPTIPRNQIDGLGLSDILFHFYEYILVFDNATQSLRIIYNAPLPDYEPNFDLKYQGALWSLDQIEETLAKSEPVQQGKETFQMKIAVNTDQESFEESVLKAKEYIAAGEVFQVVLSQRFETPFPASRSLDFYRLLRRANPSPYLFHLDFGDGFKLVGASPEVMVSVQDRNMLLRPLAGTRKRGATAEEDAALAENLRRDPKDCAEHGMLVDLGRNDVGKFAEPGSVKVEGLMRPESYGAVIHLATDIRGRLKEGVSSFEALLGCLPAGTLSGAPKIRALQLIAELEPCQRGSYGGAVGWFTDTDLDTCIMIRSAVIYQNKLYWQVGAGIVADSDPASEYQETLNKSISIRKVLMQMAGEQQ